MEKLGKVKYSYMTQSILRIHKALTSQNEHLKTASLYLNRQSELEK